MIKPTFLVFLSLPFWGCTPQAKPESKTPSPPGQSTTSTLTTSQSPTVINTSDCPNTAVSTITGWILPSTTDTPCPEPTPYEKEWMREDPTVKDCFKEAHCTKYIKKLNQKMIVNGNLKSILIVMTAMDIVIIGKRRKAFYTRIHPGATSHLQINFFLPDMDLTFS